ncbi:hypothetical protein FQN54_006606 [Arachnomyces sp. PD_36]|nr:hypothetical protein FQN54_006606 [Arachnomyces sp. PD_36]
MESSKTIEGAMMGCANYHARIRFDDGSRSWLLRVPRVTSVATALPSKLVDYLVLSEYTTLKFLEVTNVPTPRVFSYGLCDPEHENDVGIGYILMEEVPGKPWMGGSGEVSEDEKANVLSGLADILLELERHPFPMAGSLSLQSSSDIGVSAVASDRFLVLTPRGPFTTSSDYYTAFIEQYLELIADGQLYTQYPVDAYLVHRFLKDNIPQLLSDQESQTAEKFYLKHVDDKGDHLFVDEDLNITGIIDWQMARVVPRREAFGASLVTADMNALCSATPSMSSGDVMLSEILRGKGSPDLADLGACDEKARRFFWGLALESEWEDAQPMAEGILKTFGVTESWDQWKEKALKEYQSDEGLAALLSFSA